MNKIQYKKKTATHDQVQVYKNFPDEHFKNSLNEDLTNNTKLDYNSFEKQF